MWSFVKLVFLFVLATVFHWAFASGFSLWGMGVNMMLVFAVAFCAVLKPVCGYPAAFVCGLFLDFFGTKLFGNNAFTFAVAACVVYGLSERFDFDGIFPQMLTVFGLTFLVGALNSVLIWWFASAVVWPGLWSLLGGAVVSALLAPGVFWLVRRTLGKGAVCRPV